MPSTGSGTRHLFSYPIDLSILFSFARALSISFSSSSSIFPILVYPYVASLIGLAAVVLAVLCVRGAFPRGGKILRGRVSLRRSDLLTHKHISYISDLRISRA